MRAVNATLPYIILSCSLFWVTASQATPSAEFGVQTSNGVFLDAGGSIPLPQGSLALLVWSSDTSYTVPVEGAIPLTRGSALGNDYVLWSGGTSILGGFDVNPVLGMTYSSADVGGGDILTGNAYLMVFASSSPVAGTRYVLSSMTLAPLGDASLVPPPVPNYVDVAPLTYAYMGQPGLSGAVAAPEPCTMRLILVGLSMVALRAFYRRLRNHTRA